MKYLKGSRRIVLIFPKLGFVIKLPRIFIWVFMKRMFKFFPYYPKNKWQWMKKWFKYDVDVLTGFRDIMYKGIHDNWYERQLYKKTKNVLLQPTYFSFFGILNIQKYGEIHKMYFAYLLQEFMNLTEDEAWKDNHHFANWRNFCFENGKLKIIDYGSKRTQKIILKYGEKIAREFDFEKVKQKSLGYKLE